MPFNIALSGLNAASTNLEVTGNNIANAATTGFKESRAEFADLYASSLQDAGANAVGQGVRVSRVAQQFSQGSIDFTSNNLDLAISGEGFFVLEGSDGTYQYTRAGAFNVDRDGNVVNHSNDRLQVYGAAVGIGGATTFNTGVLEDLQLPTTASAPSASTLVSAVLNLDSSGSVPTDAFDPANPASYNGSTSATVYDSLGNAHASTMYFRKSGSNSWEQYQYIDGTEVPPSGQAAGTPFTLDFDATGNLSAVNGAAGTSAVADPYDPGNGASPINLTLEFVGTTQYASAFAVNNLSQDGYTSGRLSGVDIDTEGVIFARYTNGQSTALGKVALAKFNNQQGLSQAGDTNWSESFQSGAAQLGEAGTSSFGSIQSGALEASNVDISAQLVNLIIAQRNFQANAEVISTADSVTQTIINIR